MRIWKIAAPGLLLLAASAAVAILTRLSALKAPASPVSPAFADKLAASPAAAKP